MRTTHLLLVLLAGIAGAPSIHAQVVRRAMPSGRATTTVTLADTVSRADAAARPVTIALDYGQPHLRGRGLHTDSLVPYDAPWRTGANATTRLTTGIDLVLGGVSVPAGTYIVLTLPTRDGWTLILQTDAGQGAGELNPAHDVARIALRRRALPIAIESLTMWLIPSAVPGPPSGELRIMWGTTELSTDWSVR